MTKNRGMRKIKAKDKKRKRGQLVLVLLGGIFFTLLVGASYRFYRLVSDAVWDGKNRINLAFQAKPVLVTSFSLEEASLKTLVISEGTLIEVIHGYGFYRAESIYQLGELEGQGGELLTSSLQEYLGLPIDGYIKDDNLEFSTQNPAEFKRSLVRAMIELAKGKGKTNLTRWDIFRLWWEIRKLKTKEVALIDLGETNALSLVVLPDESQAAEVDLERLDRIVQPLFIDERIRFENLAIVVLNGTSYPGLARRGTRLISNIGGRVTGVAGSKGRRARCEVRSKKGNKNSYTVKKIAKVFDCQWGGENLEDQRAEVVVILGEDYGQKFTPHPRDAGFTH